MKLPLPNTLRNRRADTTRGPRVLNGLVDSKGRVQKRPGLIQAFEAITAGPGLGLFVRDTPNPAGGITSEVIAIANDVLTQSPVRRAAKLRFSVQPPPEANLDSAFSPAVVVQILDVFNSVATSATNTITMTLTTNPTNAALGGTTSVAAVAGVATFSNLQLNRSGEGFRITASGANLRSATSDAFNLPTQLVFTTQPSTTQPDTAFTVVVAARDSAGTTDANYGGDITLSLYAGAGDGILDGLTTRLAVNGVATFSGLSITEEATYSLRAAGTVDPVLGAYTPAPNVSNSFQITNATHTLIAAFWGNDAFGFATDDVPPAVGSLSPATLNGVEIIAIINDLVAFDGNLFFSLQGAPFDQTFFTSITIGSTTLLTNEADDFFSAGAETRWTWIQIPPMISGAGTFQVNIV